MPKESSKWNTSVLHKKQQILELIRFHVVSMATITLLSYSVLKSHEPVLKSHEPDSYLRVCALPTLFVKGGRGTMLLYSVRFDLITQEYCISNAEGFSCRSWAPLTGNGDDIITELA